MAQAILQALGLDGHALFIQADLVHNLPFTSSPWLPLPPRSLALFFDPARRSQGRRVFSVRQYQPPLAIIRDWLEQVPALGVKISPGVNLDELAGYDAEVEFISFQGELKEAVMWFGPLKTALRRATILPGEHTLMLVVPILIIVLLARWWIPRSWASLTYRLTAKELIDRKRVV